MFTLGPVYAQRVTYPPKLGLFPLSELGWTNEIEEPFRHGRCVVLRVPFTSFGCGFGIWIDKGLKDPTVYTEEQQLELARNGRPLDFVGVDEF